MFTGGGISFGGCVCSSYHPIKEFGDVHRLQAVEKRARQIMKNAQVAVRCEAMRKWQRETEGLSAVVSVFASKLSFMFKVYFKLKWFDG